MWEMKGDVGCAPRQRALRARPSPGAPTLRRAENALLPNEPKSPLPKADRRTKGHRGSVNYPRKHSGNVAFIRAKMNANTSSGCDFRVSSPSQQFAWLFLYGEAPRGTRLTYPAGYPPTGGCLCKIHPNLFSYRN